MHMCQSQNHNLIKEFEALEYSTTVIEEAFTKIVQDTKSVESVSMEEDWKTISFFCLLLISCTMK